MERSIDDRFRKASAYQFRSLLESTHNGAFVLLGVRSPEEYQNKSMVGARNVPVDAIESSLGTWTGTRPCWLTAMSESVASGRKTS